LLEIDAGHDLQRVVQGLPLTAHAVRHHFYRVTE